MPTAKVKNFEPELARDGKIIVTAQQSRFHELDDSASKDIDIGNLCISVGKRPILQHTRLVLKAGFRYVFVGRNGLGKSTLLKALAERRIPGISPNIRILLLDQTTIERSQNDMLSNTTGGEESSVLEKVVASDRFRQRLVEDTAALNNVLQNASESPNSIVQVYRRLKFEQEERNLEAARLVAEHRSGARGSKARQVVLAHEASLKEAMGMLGDDIEDLTTNDEIDAAVNMLELLQIALDAMGASSLEARARTVLIGLGFTANQIEEPMSKLSGGWQTRAALAAALIQSTDLLLLDEPTNFLDLPAVIWLQHYLTTSLAQSTTLVVTTHDRDFAEAVAERLLVLRANPPCTLETFTGSLGSYYSEKRKQIRRMTKMSEAQDQKEAHSKSAIEKSLTAAKRSGDDKKLKQAASRKKKLEERSGMEVNVKGHRFKLNRDLGGFHLTNRAGIEIPELDPPVTMAFPSQPPELRNPSALVILEDASFTYKRAKSPTLNNINLTVHPGSRTALVGLNGSGKSTLVNLIIADFTSHSSSPGVLQGTLDLHSQARIAHYTQHSTTRLLAFGQANPNLTALSYLHQRAPQLAEQNTRATLSGLSLAPQAQANTPLVALSGGQLVRVALAEALLPMPPHLLILDEPTTHLDADSIIALIGALRRYEGALLVVSHDRFFVRCVVEGMSVAQASTNQIEGAEENEEDASSDEDEIRAAPGAVYRLTRTSGRMIRLERGMDEYEEIVVRQLAKNGIEI